MSDNPTTFMDALSKYKLNWEVDLRPVLTLGNDGQPLAIADAMATVRSDIGLPLSVVGSRYTPIQQNAFATIFDGVLAQTGGEYINGGMFGNGRKVFLQVKLPDTITVKGKDASHKILTFINSHDMTTQALAGFNALRIVCMNTFKMAVRDLLDQVVLRHTKSVDGKLKTVEAILMGQLVYFRELEIKANWLADQKFTDIQMDLALRQVLNVKGEEVPTRTVNIMDQIKTNFISGSGIDAGNRGTAWAAYNAFTEYTNHQRNVRNVDERGGEESVRAESILIGTGAAMNGRALEVIESFVS